MGGEKKRKEKEVMRYDNKRLGGHHYTYRPGQAKETLFNP